MAQNTEGSALCGHRPRGEVTWKLSSSPGKSQEKHPRQKNRQVRSSAWGLQTVHSPRACPASPQAGVCPRQALEAMARIGFPSVKGAAEEFPTRESCDGNDGFENVISEALQENRR